mmetsp:Transcript_31123/g.30575  ORF Transcript_31123/g.30575 Transcript_31123/m.30575 type:complete len:94 (+) Transcript_31123:956-1237(+)
MSSLGFERSPTKDYQEFKDVTQDLGRKVKELSKTVEDLHMTLNEKEAEIIRLTLCLGDEKKKARPENTPKRNLRGSSNYGSELPGKASDSPYF